MIRIKNTEFFTFEEDLWYRLEDGTQHRMTENDEVVKLMYEHMADFYPEALEKLEERYKGYAGNMIHFRFKVVRTFCKCNFGLIDNVPDIDQKGALHFEHVPCPLRGECCMEGIVCHPKINSKISAAELRVLELLYEGNNREDIACKLCLSPHTVRNHIKNAFQRIGVHSEAEFITYANTHNLFR